MTCPFASTHHRATPAAFLLALVALAAPALAVDGVLEINQACVAAGCFAGDTAGFPVQITSPGSYRLTSNLDVRPAVGDVVLITANDVSLDLNGFTILGPMICSGLPVTCDPSAVTGNGVLSSGGGTSVRNGVVRGMGLFGIALTAQGNLVENVRAVSNRTGISVSGGTAIQNVAILNLNVGIEVTGGTLIQNTATGNGVGLNVLQGLASHNTSFSNSGPGLLATLSGYFGNAFADNNGASPEVSGGVNLGHNLCDVALCP